MLDRNRIGVLYLKFEINKTDNTFDLNQIDNIGDAVQILKNGTISHGRANGKVLGVLSDVYFDCDAYVGTVQVKGVAQFRYNRAGDPPIFGEGISGDGGGQVVQLYNNITKQFSPSTIGVVISFDRRTSICEVIL